MTHHYHANVIGSICSSRATELSYRQLRDQLDTDEDINESMTGIMERRDNGHNAQTHIEQIRTHYRYFQRLICGRFLEEVREFFDGGQAGGHRSQELEYVGKCALYSCIYEAEVQLKETLAGRMCYPFYFIAVLSDRNPITGSLFNAKAIRRHFIGLFFVVWLVLAIILFHVSVCDEQCGSEGIFDA